MRFIGNGIFREGVVSSDGIVGVIVYIFSQVLIFRYFFQTGLSFSSVCAFDCPYATMIANDRSSPQFAGFDTSIAPTPDGPSIVAAYEAMGMGRFGDSGCTAISAAITQTLQSIPVKVCNIYDSFGGVLVSTENRVPLQRTGYCGIMLPPLEDTVR